MAENFSYADVEAILARVHGASTADALPKLRARYKKLRAAGILTGDTPSRGERSSYNLDQLLRLSFGFELVEFGLDYETISYWLSQKMFAIFGQTMRNFVSSENNNFDDVFYFTPFVFSTTLQSAGREPLYGFLDLPTIIEARFIPKFCVVRLRTVFESLMEAIQYFRPDMYDFIKGGSYRF